jgi:hypothetical protein
VKRRLSLALSAAAFVVAVLSITLLGSAAVGAGTSAKAPLKATGILAKGLTGKTSPAVIEKLLASVGPDQTTNITLKHLDGTPVLQLVPGTYEIDVTDSSGDSSFHLTGPGVDVGTGVAEYVTTTWTVTFTDGQYKFFCDFMPSIMHGTFLVGAAPPPPPPPPPPPRACVVPNVKGKTLHGARTGLAAAHCRLGKVGSAFSGVKTGRVISQSARAGKHLAHLAKVNVVLSRGHKH